MFASCRATKRICWGKLLYSHRSLSGADAAIALRPFYFAVHPDFFGRHPREREVNENSLKRLNGYLENLQRPGLGSHKPAQLTFYVRETIQNPGNDQDSWIQSNQEEAEKKLSSSIPLREELQRLKTELSDELQLSNVQWQRSWGIAHRCSQLHSLRRLIKHSSESLKMAKGHTVIFTDRTGMSAAGHVMLGTMDVHHQWTKLFERLPSYYILQRKLLQLQERIGHLLGGIEIVHIEELQPMLTMEEHYSALDAFCKKLLNRRVHIHPRSLRGLQMILENDHFVPRLHEKGHFIIPAVCDPPSLQWFLLAHAEKAREKLKRKAELKIEEQALIKACKEGASLSRLYKEPSVSSEQMISCCRRLIEEPLPNLLGMHLCVSHYYSVLQDGDLCIPWNWKH
ncbi:hypothetical protein GDO78_002931 [Eleutherodactylus coqui]|uniref:T-cell activation inhibitor, mitochondrial n=1 Tax=Eleutherodactylus coqui TaxID=57060 RepID=A0A8J6K1J0_ELECQ|nr:hypothetical protein GDO78_002931 [Eleutherodactylus coqui]